MRSESGKTILLVEDELIIAMTEKKILEKYGYGVFTVRSGEKAVETVDATPGIDLILMDINLGDGMDGTRAAEIILQRHDLPLIFLSSHTEREIVEKTEKITSYGYIVKMSGEMVLMASIKMALRLYDAQRKEKEKEIALRQNEFFLYKAQEIGKIGHFSYDPATGIVEGSPELFRIFDADREQPLFKAFSDSVHPEDGHLIFPFIDRAVKEGISYDTRYRVLHKNRTVLFVHAKGEIAVTALGRRMVGTIQDITERKRTEEMVQESEEKFSKAFQMSPHSMAISNLEDGVYRDVNNAFLSLTGFSREEIIGRSSHELNTWVDKGLRERFRLDIEAGREVTLYPVSLRMKSGEVRDVLYSAVNVQISGAPYWLSMVFDITERKLAEDALRHERNRAQGYLNTVETIIVALNSEGRITSINRKGCQLFGRREDELIGQLWFSACLPQPEGMENVYPVFVKLMAGEIEGVEYFENPILTRNGELRQIAWHNALLRDEEGQIIGTLSSGEDITDRKRAEEKIKTLLAEKELLLKEVNHRIKNSMNTISSLLSLQADALTEPTAISALRDARGRVDSMRVLYDRLYHSEDFRELSIYKYLPSLVDEIVANFPNSISVRVVKKIDDFMLDAKRLQALGIIVNELLTNIMKYAFTGRDNGKISVTVSVKGKQAVFMIHDNGIGMPESVDFDNSSGFGLMLVGLLTQQLHGSIRIERKRGTKIILEFEI